MKPKLKGNLEGSSEEELTWNGRVRVEGAS